MIKSLCIMGRQPAIGRAELEALYGADKLHIISEDVVGLDIEATDIDFERLGGTIKLCSVIQSYSFSGWQDIEQILLEEYGSFIMPLPDSKLQLGISLYGLSIDLKKLQNTGLRLKQKLKSTNQSVRLIPNQSTALSSAQVVHNHLVGLKGLELVLVVSDGQCLLAKSVAVQDISSYAYRDRGRPKRDPRVGMLPPKLAQIIINLANPIEHAIVLDPFCGTGVVLQEAALMGLSVYGSDLEPRMIDYSKSNLEWLQAAFDKPKEWLLEVGDASKNKWQDFDVVVSETYLGQAFSAFPEQEKLTKVVQTTNSVIEGFLKNIHGQIASGCRLSLAVPAWQLPANQGFKHLPLLDHLEVLGYNRISFSHARRQDLIYCRPGQVVGRELIVIVRI